MKKMELNGLEGRKTEDEREETKNRWWRSEGGQRMRERKLRTTDGGEGGHRKRERKLRTTDGGEGGHRKRERKLRTTDGGEVKEDTIGQEKPTLKLLRCQDRG